MDISIVIPIRITAFRKDILERLSFCYEKGSNGVEYIIVDDGSSIEDAMLLQKKCKKLGYKYISTDINIAKPFNLARARNTGVKAANGKYVLFLDVDLLICPGFYQDLQTEIDLFNIRYNSDLFLMFPVIYLNNKGLDQYRKQKESLKKHFGSQILLGDKFDLIEKYSYGTSCILVDRLYYLSIGGQDERFEGWGYEDYDFTTKMMKLSSLFPAPQNFGSMKGNFMTIKEYYGWKAEYRLNGMWMARKNMYLYHVPHAIDNSYHENKNQNLALLKKSISKDFSKSFLQTIEPGCEKSLILSKNPFCCHYKLNSILGKYEVLDISNITYWEDILNYYKNNDFTQIVFPNPYVNEMFLKLYRFCRDNCIKYIVAERGALPGSVYHDRNGFLFDSSSYGDDKWDYPLSEIQQIEIKEYISLLSKGEETLESQPKKITKEDVLVRLNLDKTVKKKILIIFQTKNDTVIKFFGREFKTQKALKYFIEDLVQRGSKKYDFIYKNHPLEVSPIEIKGGINADDFHINDLIDICDGVITINSGAGLIAALLGKPVFTLGDCWYTLPGIACDIKNDNEFLLNVESFMPDKHKLIRFAYYLRFKFYSFGKHHTVVHSKKDYKINATLDIHYTEVQTFRHGRIYFKDINYKVGFDSLLFKEYILNSAQQKVNKKRKNLSGNRKIKKLLNDPKSFFRDAIINFVNRL